MARPALHDRQRTLEKALNLFWSKGYQATSMKDLEQALDMRPGSIYAAFGNKFGLFKEATLVYTEAKIAQLNAMINAADNPLTGLVNVLHHYAGQNREEVPSCACFLVRSLIELENGDAEAKALVALQLNRMEELFRLAFENAISQKLIAPNKLRHTDKQYAYLFQMKLTGLRIAAMHITDQSVIQLLREECAQFLHDLQSD